MALCQPREIIYEGSNDPAIEYPHGGLQYTPQEPPSTLALRDDANAASTPAHSPWWGIFGGDEGYNQSTSHYVDSLPVSPMDAVAQIYHGLRYSRSGTDKIISGLRTPPVLKTVGHTNRLLGAQVDARMRH